MRLLGSIGFLGQGWSPDAGGIEVHTAALAGGLVEQGIQVAALAWGSPLGGPGIVRQGGVTVTRTPRGGTGLAVLDGDAESDKALHRWLDKCRPDLVHVHHLSGWGTRALKLLHRRGVPVIVTLHDDWLICPRGQRWHSENYLCITPDPATCAQCLGQSHSGLGLGAADIRQRLLEVQDRLLTADRILAPSATLLEAHQRAGVLCAGVGGNGEVSSLGIDADVLQKETTRLRAIRGEDKVLRLGVLGSLQPSKGVLHLAKAVIAADRPDLVLEVHGPRSSYHGDEQTVKEIEILARKHPAIRLHPEFPSSRRSEVLAMLDGVAVPSLWEEGFGLVAREARAVGLPVLASSIGGLAQLQGDPGVKLIAPGDQAAWVEALAVFERGLIPPLSPIKCSEEMTAQVLKIYQSVLEERAQQVA